MAYCEDCGTKLSGGICPNCQEELYIFTEQNEFLGPVSDEFINKVKEQEQEVKRKKYQS